MNACRTSKIELLNLKLKLRVEVIHWIVEITFYILNMNIRLLILGSAFLLFFFKLTHQYLK